ncbi:hypothetical protein FBEOM_6054 [Fusarium beomiforme]|uniref:Uncharacterized protein n=1 Tax=Fusarium beomiforme TaxID=44412 RepID=A0A9P5DYD8_9HYPO|nr:hypothetical protein FBEOM_6054 [Fusarium beomiforme]
MRFALLCSLLVVKTAVASVCKPRQSGGSSTDTSAGIEATTTASVDVPTSIVTSAAEDVTTTEAATSVESTETAVSTTTIAETTTSDTPGPLETFILAAKVPNTVNEDLSAAERDGASVYLPTPRFITSGPLIVSFDSTMSYLQSRSGFYLCVAYGDGTAPNGVKLCSSESLRNPAFGALTCEQTYERKVTCTAPAGQCIGGSDEAKVCSSLPGMYDQFYFFRDELNRVNIGIGPTGNSDENQNPIELKAKRSNT